MNHSRNYRLIALVGVILVFLTIGPTILAAKSGPPEYSFQGFLFNPIDGGSYLGKMFQGWQGHWKYYPPYAPDPGQGSYLYMLYIFLGHLARFVDLPLISVFHLARLVGVVALLLSLYYFFDRTLVKSNWRGAAFALGALASGMGWLAIPFGGITSDFWVAEMYPFLSAYANPHFALGLALLLFILTPKSDFADGPDRISWGDALAALLLALVYPFGIVVAMLVLGSQLAWHLWPYSLDKIPRVLKSRVLWIAIFGGPILLYDFWVVHVDPVLANWISQSDTFSPPVWDMVLSLSPFLWLAIPGAFLVIKRRDARELSLLFWVGLVLPFIYLPISQPRRFLMGFFVPVVGLAVIGLEGLTKGSRSRLKLYTIVLFGLAIPTNLMLLLGGYQAIQTHDLRIYMTRSEVSAFQWLESNTPIDALILASPQTGVLIPGQTGRRVIYGNTYETFHAEQAKEEVTHFYITGDPAILAEYPFQYVFYGPREAELNPTFPLPSLEQVYSDGGVSIYAVPP